MNKTHWLTHFFPSYGLNVCLHWNTGCCVFCFHCPHCTFVLHFAHVWCHLLLYADAERWQFTVLPHQMLGGYGEFLYQTGMIDELQKQYVDQQTDHGVKLIQQEKWVEAFEVMSWCCSSSTFAVFSNCWRHTCHGCLFHFNFNRLTSGLWSFAEWRCRSLSLLLPKCNRLYQLLQLLDMSGTRSSLKFFFVNCCFLTA